MAQLISGNSQILLLVNHHTKQTVLHVLLHNYQIGPTTSGWLYPSLARQLGISYETVQYTGVINVLQSNSTIGKWLVPEKVCQIWIHKMQIIKAIGKMLMGTRPSVNIFLVFGCRKISFFLSLNIGYREIIKTWWENKYSVPPPPPLSSPWTAVRLIHIPGWWPGGHHAGVVSPWT